MQKIFEFEPKVVGSRIKKARVSLNKTQEAISVTADISPQYWSAIETGRERGSINTYLKMSVALGVTLDDLFYNRAEKIVAEKTDFGGILSECSDFEKMVLVETFLGLKSILINFRKLQ